MSRLAGLVELANQWSEALGVAQLGDGIILVYLVDDVIRVRTGERGKEALHYEDDIDSK